MARSTTTCRARTLNSRTPDRRGSIRALSATLWTCRALADARLAQEPATAARAGKTRKPGPETALFAGPARSGRERRGRQDGIAGRLEAPGRARPNSRPRSRARHKTTLAATVAGKGEPRWFAGTACRSAFPTCYSACALDPSDQGSQAACIPGFPPRRRAHARARRPPETPEPRRRPLGVSQARPPSRPVNPAGFYVAPREPAR